MKTDADNIAATPRPPGAQLRYPLWMDPARDRLPESRRSAGMMGRAPAASRGTDPPGCDWQRAWGTRVGPGWAWGAADWDVPSAASPVCLWVPARPWHGRLRARPPAPGAPPAPRPLLASPGLAAGGRGSPWGELMSFEGKRSRRRGRSRRGGRGTAQHGSPAPGPPGGHSPRDAPGGLRVSREGGVMGSSPADGAVGHWWLQGAVGPVPAPPWMTIPAAPWMTLPVCPWRVQPRDQALLLDFHHSRLPRAPSHT